MDKMGNGMNPIPNNSERCIRNSCAVIRRERGRDEIITVIHYTESVGWKRLCASSPTSPQQVTVIRLGRTRFNDDDDDDDTLQQN